MAGFWLALMCAPAFSQMTLQSSVIGGGGGVAVGGSSVIAGTIAQTIIGPVTNSSNAMGQGFWYMLPNLSTTGVEYDPGMAGSAVVLHQNVPNPFSTTTRISFDLPAGGAVSLKLYDLVGREVRTLVDGVRDAGRVTMALSADKLESGYYTARLVANGVTRTITMVVVR